MSDSRGNRYTAATMMRARELREAGWFYKDIAMLLERELDLRVTYKTVERWCIPDELRERRMEYQRRHRARERAQTSTPRASTPEWREARMRELRDAGMNLTAIGICSTVLWGVPLSREQAGRMLGEAAA